MKERSSATVMLLGTLLGSAVAALTFVLFSARTSAAEEFVIPQRFAPGDLLSADQFNEAFDEIEAANRWPRETDLVGAWRCDAYHGAAISPVPEWSTEPAAEGLTLAKLAGVEITFSEQNGEFSFTTSAPDPFWSSRADALTSTFKIIGDVLFYRGIIPENGDEPFLNHMRVIKSGQNRFMLFNTCGLGCVSTGMLVCDRIDVRPPPPQTLAASPSGAAVDLSWSFTGAEEVSFRVLRKAGLQDPFELLAETAAGETTYSDEPGVPGTYWYRVTAVSSSAESLGSNEIRVTLE